MCTKSFENFLRCAGGKGSRKKRRPPEGRKKADRLENLPRPLSGSRKRKDPRAKEKREAKGSATPE